MAAFCVYTPPPHSFLTPGHKVTKKH
jgi:hypothetical protein